MHRILSLLHDTLDILQLPQNSSFLKAQKCQRTVTQNYFYSWKSAFFQNLKQLQVNRISNICSEQSSTLCSSCPLPKTEAKCSYFSHHSSQAKDTEALQIANSSTHVTPSHTIEQGTQHKSIYQVLTDFTQRALFPCTLRRNLRYYAALKIMQF